MTETEPSPKVTVAYVCDNYLLEETQKIPNVGYRVSIGNCLVTRPIFSSFLPKDFVDFACVLV